MPDPELMEEDQLLDQEGRNAIKLKQMTEEKLPAMGGGMASPRNHGGYEVRFMEQDNSPDFLQPSNGGYNPKIKSIFVPPDKTVKGTAPEIPIEAADVNINNYEKNKAPPQPMQPRSTKSYAQILR